MYMITSSVYHTLYKFIHNFFSDTEKETKEEKNAETGSEGMSPLMTYPFLFLIHKKKNILKLLTSHP